MNVAAARDHREILRETAGYRLHRSGRFLVAELLQPHLVLSTSVRNGGQSETLRYLLNHQSCEAAAHLERHEIIHSNGLRSYHDRACGEAGLDPSRAALMGTAANMNYASLVEHRSDDVTVAAIVTAGVTGNAECAADPTTWREGPGGFQKTSPYDGTINTMVLIDRALTPNALAGAAMVMTEAKGAALQRLAVRSRYSREFATGTNTDQYCLACRRDALPALPALTSASTGVRLGELIGRAVRDATLEALRWQNGLEPSYARSIFHALGAYGLKEETFFDDIAPYLTEAQLGLLKANKKAVVYEPLVAAAAFAIAAVLDRLRHGILPESAAREALRQQLASMATGLAARPDRWPALYRSIEEFDLEQPARVVSRALALGWAAKWS
jgi:adenosylcobinamide amidohydrolase